MRGLHSSVQDMANLLELRKNVHHHTVLLLGSRVGKLFRSERFYENLQLLSPRNFHQLSRVEQFRECFNILTSNNAKLTDTDIHSILSSSLYNIGITNSDISLATLIKNSYFDEIISTNIDDTLDNALAKTEMKIGRDYEILPIGRNIPQYRKNCFCRITKVFGDIASRDYTIKDRTSHLENSELKSFLQYLLAKDLLIVGIDPVWDQDILRIVPMKTQGTMWFVSDEDDIINKLSFLSDTTNERSSTYISGNEGNYAYFISKIHEYLYANISPNYLFTQSETIQNIQQQVTRMAETLEQLI